VLKIEEFSNPKIQQRLADLRHRLFAGTLSIIESPVRNGNGGQDNQAKR
jgi:hypothetical protein